MIHYDKIFIWRHCVSCNQIYKRLKGSKIRLCKDCFEQIKQQNIALRVKNFKLNCTNSPLRLAEIKI